MGALREPCQAGNLQLQEAALGSSYPSTAPTPPKSDRISDSALSDSLTHPRVQAADLAQHLQGIRNEDTLSELSCKSRAGCWQWSVAAPAVTCPRPSPALTAFLLLKTKNVEEFQVWLLPKQAAVHGREGAPGQWPWNGSVSGLGQFCAALQVTAKTRFEIYSFTSGSESYRADDWLKSSTKFIFNFLSFPNSKGKDFCSISDLEGSNCYTRKSSGPQTHRYQWIIATERQNRWPHTLDAGLPLYHWP